MSFFLSVLSFLQIEKERGYTKFGIRRNNPKVTYLIFRRGSTGESFFFHGLIDFKLFLTLAWRTWVPRVQDMFLSSSPGVMAMGLSATSPAKQLPFLLSISADGKESPLLFWGHSQSFGFSLPPLPVSGDLGLLSTNICWYLLCDLHSFLTVTFLTGCHCSFQREDSINLISIVSVGYHVTIYIYIYIYIYI